MESNQKNRLLTWLLVFLVVVNLAALATYFIFPQKQVNVNCAGDASSPGCVLHAELSLSEEQVRQVERINAGYRQVSGPVSTEIKELRGTVLDELASEMPDTLALERLATDISLLQGKLHRENIRHYLELKKACTPEQALRLSNLYREIYGCPMQGQGNEMHRHRHRHQGNRSL